DIAQIAAEAVLVEPLAGREVPQAAGIGAYLVSQHDRTTGGAAELDLEVDELETERREVVTKGVVDRCGEVEHRGQLVLTGQAERHGAGVVERRVSERVVLVTPLDDYRFERQPLLDAVTLREAT